MLRIDKLGLIGRHVKQVGVETRDVVENATGPDITRSLKNVTPSIPSTRLRHNSSTFSALGNRPAMPTIAISSSVPTVRFWR